MIKRIKKKGIVKEYRSRTGSEHKFFLVFEDQSKVMFPASVYDSINEGDVIEFEGTVRGEWINVDRKKFELKIVSKASTSTAPQTTTTASTTTQESEKEEIEVEVNYLTKPRPNRRGQAFTMAKFLQNQPTENLYIPLKTIPEAIREEVLQGYGTLKVKGNQNDNTFFVDEVVSFKPTIKVHSSEVEIKNVKFSLYSISFFDNGRYITIPQDKVPFEFSPVFNSIKSSFKGTIKVKGEFRKVGKFQKDKTTKKWQEVVSWHDNETLTYDFSDIDTDEIKKIEAKHQQDIEYAKLLATLKHNPAFTSMKSIKKMFKDKGLDITTEQIEELYWDERYDKEYYNTLKRKADDIFVSNEEFVFTMIVEGREFRIVEKPVIASATYIFNDSCDKDLLLERLKKTQRFDIIRDSHTTDGKSLQVALGYKGRVIHQEHDQWLHKIQKVIGDGVEKELIDKFIW